MHDKQLDEALAIARHYVDGLGVGMDRVQSAYTTILTFLTPAWFDECKKRSRKATLFDKHPCYHDLILAGPRHLSATLELATYLDAFSSQPEFERVLRALRDIRSFESTRFELAMAYRFSMLCPQVLLQPSIGGKHADFSVVFSGAEWVCECVSQNVSEEYRKCESVGEAVLEGLGRMPKRATDKVTIKVDMRPPYGVNLAQEVIRQVKEYIREWDQRPWHTYTTKIGNTSIEVYSFCDADDPNPYSSGGTSEWSIMDWSRIKKKTAAAFKRNPGKPHHQQACGRLFWRIQLPKIDVENGVLKRVKDKLDQISAIREHQHRVVLVETMGSFEDFDNGLVAPEIFDLLRTRRRVAAIFLMFRYYRDGRWRYGGPVYPNTASEWSVPCKFTEELQKLEHAKPYD